MKKKKCEGIIFTLFKYNTLIFNKINNLFFNKMNSTEIRRKVLLSGQSALLGQIYPSIRGIAIGFSGTEKLKLVCYLDREPDEEDYENISLVTTYICADIKFSKAEEICIYSKEPFRNLDSLNAWVYMRKE